MNYKNNFYHKFEQYKVISVESFLNRLLGAQIMGKIKHFLPQASLKGLVNITQFVLFKRMDSGRKMISRDMLRDGLTRQCGFILPADCCAYDLVIPV